MSRRRFTLFEAKQRPTAPAPMLGAECGVDRRQALAVLSAGMAAALSACGKPHETIVPYVDQPVGLTPGQPQRYATALALNGYARGVTAISVEGRPIKIEGARNHPYSLGSTDVFAEAQALSLYDPTRMQSVSGPDGPSSWEGLQAVLTPRLAQASTAGGEGLALFTGRVVSPTELGLVAALQAACPKMTWRRYEPVHDDAEMQGARLAFGRALTVLPRLADAEVVLCLDADPLGPGPEQVASARGFVAARKPGSGRFSRVYAAESGWTLTGANADHRLALHPELVRNLALAVASELGAPSPSVALPDEAIRFAHACAADLKAAPGRAMVLAGRSQPAEVHALAHWINLRLRAPVAAIAPIDPHPEGHGQSLAALAADLHAGRVHTLILIGGNPAYDAPGELGMAAAIKRAGFSLHLSGQENETSALCAYRAPLSHALESWGDARAPDGTASIVQPLIRPLRDSRTAGQLLAMLGGAQTPSDYALVRAAWASQAGAAAPEPPMLYGSGADGTEADQAAAAATGQVPDPAWTQWLTDGVIPGTAATTVMTPPAAFPAVTPTGASPGLVLSLSPDPTLFDGAYAENAWLQECPKPMSSEVWGASVAVSPQDAKRLGLKPFDHIRLSRAGRSVTAPVRIVAGQAAGVISGYIGGGRTAAGPIGSRIGTDFGPLRTLGAPWTVAVEVEKAPGHGGPPSFQSMYTLEGEASKLSPLVDVLQLAHLKADPLDRDDDPPSMLPPDPADGRRPKPAHEPAHEPAWAMVIDQASCIGCNACVVSCQAENNVPVVGPAEVARGRDMHWLRIDTYVHEDQGQPLPAFQPVPCMQCEHAPCEPVCPVEASVHDHEGLNDQVYNRCIGTRFCQSNCPYKVRRFNWFGYAHDQAYANLGDDAYDAQKNPDVTVRSRGVMEKCTYCVQRISGARRTAEKEGRGIGADEVATACQSACPTEAIRFGDLDNPRSPIAGLREDPRHFALLAEAGARPRTTYLARVRNPNPALGGDPMPERES